MQLGFVRSPGGRWLLAALAFALLWALRAPIVVPDSSTYMQAWPTRPPLLPLLYLFGKSIGGEGFAMHMTVFVQAFFAVVSGRFLLLEFGRVTRLGAVARAFVFGAIFLPQLKASLTIASESLAYSFVCVFAALLVGAVARRINVARSLLLMVSALGAYATRAQFVYLVPIALIAVAAGCYWLEGRDRWRSLSGALAITILVFVGISLYGRIRSGESAGVSLMGVQLLTSVVHVTTASDVSDTHLVLEQDQRFANALYRRLERESLLAFQRDGSAGETASSFFAERYNMILVRLADEFRATELANSPAAKEPLLWGFSAAELRKLDRATLAVSKALIRKNWKRYLALVLGSVWEWHRYFCITVVFVSAFAVAELARNRSSAGAWLMAFSGIAWVTNICVVTLVEPPLYRYSFYFDAIFLAALCAVVADALAAPTALPASLAASLGREG